MVPIFVLGEDLVVGFGLGGGWVVLGVWRGTRRQLRRESGAV